ncbi:acylneuraminate cytidylyltransferase [Oceanispirochaeta sp.]|jgi:spore coat polysaccharide biosynthesis protein SpsF|uniref:cytidylyltransferase domain-containing protein n=1 Tax=Oceanispirochaeta sp. TaxID=2035350 RepID=UPI00263A2FE2|nr:acylneuraminate cytidylyltransferase [Oceanispirochaeta sp.]MDA3956985.1 acylneuraminate cytidylyltransferase [Oceanispirochaeta sp.]
MKKAVFLQVRLDSSRLPQKALKIIQGRTVIEHAMLSLRYLNLDDYVIVTAPGDDTVLQPLAEKCGFKVFTGDRSDVLNRYIEAGRFFKPDIIIRATGDNPLVAWEKASLVISEIENENSIDYMAMKGLPLGCGVEVFKREALERAYSLTDNPYDHEHVTPYLYRNPDQFNIQYMNHAPPMNHRVTLDTIEDYNRISKIFSDLYHATTIDFESLKEYLLQND